MKLQELFARTSLKATGRDIGLNVQMVEGGLMCKPLNPDDPRYTTDFVLPSMKMVEACRANDFDFFQPFIAAGKLTEEQMHRASERYRLGKTKSGQPIFWMIDDMLMPLDARIGNVWISTLLKRREPLLRYWYPTHCLFGQHLLSSYLKSVAIVESEASAVVLSELFPESIWMAYATTSRLTPKLFAPLEGRTVTFYPRTDPTLSTYLFFEQLADLTRRQYDIDLAVDSTLEDYATASQKERCVDILEFLTDNL